jgi:hypothetical protein
MQGWFVDFGITYMCYCSLSKQDVNTQSQLQKPSLLTALRKLESGLLILHIKEQNTGFLIRRDLEFVNTGLNSLILTDVLYKGPR